jgi:hypothetical protein
VKLKINEDGSITSNEFKRLFILAIVESFYLTEFIVNNTFQITPRKKYEHDLREQKTRISLIIYNIVFGE